jgi:hypothetical protein
MLKKKCVGQAWTLQEEKLAKNMQQDRTTEHISIRLTESESDHLNSDNDEVRNITDYIVRYYVLAGDPSTPSNLS